MSVHVALVKVGKAPLRFSSIVKEFSNHLALSTRKHGGNNCFVCHPTEEKRMLIGKFQSFVIAEF